MVTLEIVKQSLNITGSTQDRAIERVITFLNNLLTTSYNMSPMLLDTTVNRVFKLGDQRFFSLKNKRLSPGPFKTITVTPTIEYTSYFNLYSPSSIDYIEFKDVPCEDITITGEYGIDNTDSLIALYATVSEDYLDLQGRDDIKTVRDLTSLVEYANTDTSAIDKAIEKNFLLLKQFDYTTKYLSI